jgi:hypothetical protein
MSNYEDFPITSVCRADLESIGFDASNVDEGTMKTLAGQLADDYCDQLFWSSLEILAEHHKIPKQPERLTVAFHSRPLSWQAKARLTSAFSFSLFVSE